MNTGMRIYEPIVGIEGVASGGTAYIRLPQNRRHLMARLFCSATHVVGGTPTPTTNPADIIESITHLVRGREIRVESVADIIAQREFYKLPADASNALSLYYAEPWRADVLDEVITAWPMFDGEGEVVIKAKLKAGLTNPAISAINVYDGNAARVNGQIVKQVVKRFTVNKNLGTVGDFADNLPINWPILGIFLKGEAGKTIDKVKVTVNNTVVVHEMTRQENAAFLSDYNLDASKFHYPLRFDMEGQLGRRLEGISSLNVRVWSSAAQNVEAVVECVAPDYI